MNNNRLLYVLTLCLVALAAGCAGSDGGQGFGAVDRGLASVGRTAETGRAVLDAGRSAAAGGTSRQAVLGDMLASQLGVSRQQALGGAGAIFQAAKTKMAPDEFDNLYRTVPGMPDMLAAAPNVGQAISGSMPAVGDVGGTVDSMTSLAESFQRLNMPQNMVNRFIPVVVDYVRVSSGTKTASLLQSALMMH